MFTRKRDHLRALRMKMKVRGFAECTVDRTMNEGG